MGKKTDEAEADATETKEAANKEETEEGKTATPKKSKAKASGKAKPKAKAKVSTGKVPLKKPSSKKGNSTQEEQGGGKQKGTKQSLAEKTKDWEALAKKEDDGQEAGEEDEGSGEGGERDELRELGKARKFRKMSDANAIPAHILDLINEQSKKAANPRKEKSTLINKLFQKNEKGGYDMVADDPVFEQAREAYHIRFGKDQDTGMPKDVFLWSHFHGNEPALEKAISNGSVQEYQQGGLSWCSFRKTKAGIESGTKQQLQLKSGPVQVEKKQYAALTRAFSSIALTFDDSDEGEKEEQRAPAKQQKQIEAAGLTKEMTEVLADAKQAHERLHQTAMKLLGKCTNDTDKKKFKETVLSIKAWVQKNDNVLTWQEIFFFFCCCCCV